MKPRLIWKILAAFWLTVTLTGAGMMLLFFLHGDLNLDTKGRHDSQRAERLTAAAVALQYGGAPALERVTATWSPSDRKNLRLIADGRGGTRLELPHRRTPTFPIWMMVVQIAGSLLFSVALAAYLTRPIGRLQTGFKRLAQGELSARLTPGMGRRRDEIADLAHDFDAMAERLQHLVAGRDRLLHDVSHELRSPLARLNLAVALARKNRDLGEQALARIEAESERLNALVGDLLSLARVEAEAGAQEIYFDVAALLEVVCNDARFEAQPLQVDVDLRLSPELADPARAPLMTGAPELVRRAVDNVVRNALRYSPPGKTVEVGASLEAGALLIEVSDEGAGVSDELLASMFDPFVKGPGETRGVGLGLAIARRAVAAHQGSLTAGRRPTGGLSMRIAIPLSPPAPLA
jgi:two-component system OmpR family sensor kinase